MVRNDFWAELLKLRNVTLVAACEAGLLMSKLLLANRELCNDLSTLDQRIGKIYHESDVAWGFGIPDERAT